MTIPKKTTTRKPRTTTKKTTTRKPRKPRQPREKNIVSKSAICPRCGEAKAIVHRYTSSSGRKQYTCMGAECLKVRSKGRGFVVFANGTTYPRTKQ